LCHGLGIFETKYTESLLNGITVIAGYATAMDYEAWDDNLYLPLEKLQKL